MSLSRLHNDKTGRPDGTFRLKFWWWRGGGSNSRPLHCERSALPAELPPRQRSEIMPLTQILRKRVYSLIPHMRYSTTQIDSLSI